MQSRSQITIIFFFFALIFLFSCKKAELASIHVEEITVRKGSHLKGVYFINDSIGFTCGGKRDSKGYIYKTIDKGNSWSEIVVSKPRCMYDIYFINDSIGFSGGDFLYLLITQNGGVNWTPFSYKSNELPFHEENRPAIKKFTFNSDGKGYFVGGENYNKGVIYQTSNYGASWTFDTITQEMNGICLKGDNTFAAGFGYLGKVISGGMEQLSLTNDAFTGIQELEDESIIVISNTGRIYKSYNQGNDWTKIACSRGIFSKRINYKGIAFSDNKGIIISEYSMLISLDYGNNWKKADYESKHKLTSIENFNNTFYATTKEGEILKINL